MKIHETAFDRLRQAKISGEGVAAVLQQMAAGVEMFGAAASELQLDWQRPEDEIQEGDLLPVVTLSLRPAILPQPESKRTCTN